MNIFCLDYQPREAAKQHCNKHVIKMIIESAQMIANCFPENKLYNAPKTVSSTVRKHSYFNHPCSIWLRETLGNFTWFIEFTDELLREYTRRYNKYHKTANFIAWASNNKQLLQLDSMSLDVTEYSMAMPDEYKCESIPQSYHNYYLAEKMDFAKWPTNKIPRWVR